MPQVTVTFEEEGQDPASFVIPDWAVAALQHLVDDNPEKYSGKADLFAKWAVERLIAPYCERYQSYPAEVTALLAEKSAIEGELRTAIATALSTAITPPADPE